MIFIDNLYENIFQKNAKHFTELNIITGYASSSFLHKVLNDFQHLTINLYIGMYKEGISRDNHEIFSELTETSSVNVYYQVSDKQTHMKVYCFKNDRTSMCFIGSPNFSENGFETNNEILTAVKNIDEQVFLKQKNNSLLCTTENIEDFIMIYDSTKKPKESIVNEVLATYSYGGGTSNNPMSKSMSLFWNKLYNRRNNAYFNKFSFSVVLPKESDVSWYYKGINSDNPYIKQNNKVKFAEVFPIDKPFKIYAQDQEFDCEIGGKYYSNLYFTNINLYEYFASKLQLNEVMPIDAESLNSLGINNLYIERINELEYIMKYEE